MRYNEDDYIGGYTPPEPGHYYFQIDKEPEAIAKEIARGQNAGKKMLTFKMTLKCTPADGGTARRARIYVPSWVASSIWRALGYEKDEEEKWNIVLQELVGQRFEADLIHQKDKNDPTKIYAKVVNVVIPEREKPEPTTSTVDDIPEPETSDGGLETEDEEIPF